MGEKEALNKALADLHQIQQEVQKSYDERCENWWNSLTHDEKLQAFYSVIKRLKKGELDENRSYRGILYDVFGFGMEAYGIGMDCGFIDLHNSIYTKEQIEEIRNG